MSIDQKHLYLVARGGYNDVDLEAETWAYGIRLWADNSVPDDEGDLPVTGDFSAQSDSDASGGLHTTSDWKWEQGGATVINPVEYLRDQATPALATFHASDAFSSKTELREVRLYPMLGDGNAFESRVAVCSIDSPTAGGRSGDMVPPQTSIVVSWKTPRPGPKGRGRIYPPATTASGLTSDGLVNGTMQGDQADAAQALLEALAIESVSSFALHVRPIVTGHPWTQYAVITSLSVGSVPDTQRRRRRQLIETRLTRTPTYG